jgi:arginase family enzyme
MEPASCPGTGDPESAGFVSREAIIMVRDVVTQLDPGTVGFDVVPQDVRAVSRPDR